MALIAMYSALCIILFLHFYMEPGLSLSGKWEDWDLQPDCFTKINALSIIGLLDSKLEALYILLKTKIGSHWENK